MRTFERMQAADRLEQPLPERHGSFPRLGPSVAFVFGSTSGPSSVDFESKTACSIFKRNEARVGQSASTAGESRDTRGYQGESKVDELRRNGKSPHGIEVFERLFVYIGMAIVAIGLFYVGIDFRTQPLERMTSARVAMLAIKFMEFAVGIAMLFGGLAFCAGRGQKSHFIDRVAIVIGMAVIAGSILMRLR